MRVRLMRGLIKGSELPPPGLGRDKEGLQEA